MDVIDFGARVNGALYFIVGLLWGTFRFYDTEPTSHMSDGYYASSEIAITDHDSNITSLSAAKHEAKKKTSC